MRAIMQCYRLVIFSSVFHSTRMLIGAVQALYLLSTGVTLSQFAFLKGYFALLILLLDLPFSLFANRTSHKNCLHLACIFVAAYYIFSLCAPHIIYLLCAETCYACGLCMISGPFEALLMSHVKQAYPAHDTKITYFYFLMGEWTAIGSMFAAPFGVLFFTWDGSMQNLYLLSCLMMLSIPLLLCRIDEPQNLARPLRSRFSLRQWFFVQSPYILVTSLIIVAYQPIYYFWQPFFTHLADTTQHLHYFDLKQKNTAFLLATVFFSYNLVNYLSSKISKCKLSHQAPHTWLLYGLVFMLSILILCFTLSGNHFILCMLYFALIHGILTIYSNLTKSILLSQIERSKIAMTVSISNLSGRLCSAIILFGCSRGLNHQNLSYIFILSLFAIVLSILIYSHHLRKSMPVFSENPT